MTAARPGLAGTQAWMQRALAFPGQVAPEEVDIRLAASGRLTPRASLAIYQRSYVARLVSCMRQQFPALCHALGRELFDGFALDYLRACPPESYTLYDLGRRLPGFLADTRPDRDAPGAEEIWIDFMIDLATFERQLFVLFDAPGDETEGDGTGGYADPGTPDPDLRLQRCFALGAYRFPVAVYYQAVRDRREPPLPPREPSWVAVARRDFRMRIVPLTEPDHAFLATLQAGGSVADGIARVARLTGRSPDEVRRLWLAADGLRPKWIRSGFFTAAPAA